MSPDSLFFRRILLLIAIALGTTTAVAQEDFKPLSSAKIEIDEDILATFIDKPCHHFEAARETFVTGEVKQAAKHLRDAVSYLRLEAARATPDGEAALDASIAELKRLANSVEANRVKAVLTLEQAFSRAHYALAGHHCIKSNHRCCQVATFQDKQEMVRTGRDLKAATFHFEKGSQWASGKLDEKTVKLLEEAKLTANRLIQQNRGAQRKVRKNIHAIHDQLENITGLKFKIAPPMIAEDDAAPSLFK